MDFTTAYQRLQEIAKILQNQDMVDIQKLLDLQKESKELYEFCSAELKKLQENSEQV